MNKIDATDSPKRRLARHRTKASARGSRRVEVTVPACDADLVKAIAGALRSGGQNAKRIRESLELLVSAKRAQTGAELVAFFRASPIVGTDFIIERDQSAGRTVDFE